MEINIITLENNLDYIVIGAITFKEQNYLILINEKDKNDLCVRKVINKDGKEFLVKLDTEEELEGVMTTFNDKYRKGENDEE